MKKCDSKPHYFKISKCKNEFQHQKWKPPLNNASLKEALENFQHGFEVARIDTAANNISFMCNRFFATSVIKEFGIIGAPNKT